MADYTITLDANPQQVLQTFRQIEQSAQSTGQVIGQRFGEGVRKFSTESLAGLQAELNRLQQRQLTVGVNTAAFDKLGQRINEVRAQLDAASRRQLSIGVDDRSVTALQARLSTLQGELNRVAIGSKRFRELQDAVEATNRELAKAGESADGFRLLDGVVEGIGIGITNSVLGAASAAANALQGLVMDYARLDTELRQAAAADGTAGAYDKIASAVDRVGIEAAGSTQDVAALATELIRGGMTADQVGASLGDIVRGAEATGTAYAAMGSNVSAALKGFGLAASDARRVVDAMVTGANASATSVEGMGMAFKYAAPVAKILGVSIEDLGIAVGLLTNAGIDASEAGVTLRNGLSKLASAAPQAAGSTQQLSGQAADAARAMRSLGVNIYNSNGTLKPMRETLLSLKGAFDKLGPSAKIRLAASLFGGEDDGTKWLALLNQSNEEIIKMSDTMSNTGGATDKARDAMQGFEMLTKQISGTIGSLGNVLGKVTVAALTPFVQVANILLGVMSSLPGPVKDLIAGMALLTGGVIAATAATVIYQRVMASAIAQKSIAEVTALASAFRTQLSGGITAAASRLPMLIGGLTNLLLRMGYVILAYNLFNAVTGANERVGKGFAERLAETQKALESITPAAEKAGKALDGSVKVDGVEQFRSDMRSFFDIVGNFSRAADLNTIRDQTAQLQSAFDGVQDSAMQTFEALKNATTLTGEQRKDLGDRIKALEAISIQADAQAKAYRTLAQEYRAAGRAAEAKIATNNANAMQAEAEVANRLIIGLREIAVRTEGAAAASEQFMTVTERLTEATRARIAAESQISRIDQQLSIGKAMLEISKAMTESDQSRFNINKASLDLEIKQAQSRGASEGAIEAIRLRMASNDRQALSARYRALVDEQRMQASLLELEQARETISKRMELGDLRKERLKAEQELQKAASNNEKKDIELNIERLEAQIQLRESDIRLLEQTQPIQRRIAAIQAETARSALQAQAAQDGYRIAAGGSLVAVNALAQRTQQIAERELATNQQRIRNSEAVASAVQSIGAAEQSRFGVARSALEYELQQAEARKANEREIASLRQAIATQDRLALEAKYQQLLREHELEMLILAIKQRQQETTLQMGVRAIELDLSTAQINQLRARESGDQAAIAAADNLVQKQQILLAGEREKLRLTREANALERATIVMRQSAAINSVRAEQASRGMPIAPENTAAQMQAQLTINRALGSVLRENAQLVNAQSTAVSQNQLYVSRAADGSIVITNSLLESARAAQEINNANLAGGMRAAADQAERFLVSLRSAAALPAARFAGGPVEAGESYRINELGQEAFLSAGRLSMIDAPPNSIWRAPSEGVVIPAGITARLQGRTQATISHGGISGGTAELAIEVGKLRQEVGNLARRDWSVQVTQRTGPTGSQVMRTLLR